ncbi:MAG: DUF2272 domain-containing protein, partial [Bacteroidia bacterium]
DPVEWYRGFVSATFLGLPINRLIHQELATHLQRIEQQLIQQHGGIDSAVNAFGLTEELKGSRIQSSTAEYSYHIFGLGLDIEYTENPYLGSSTGATRSSTNAVFNRIGNLLDGRPFSFTNQPNGPRLAATYDRIQGWNQKVQRYFALIPTASEPELQRLLNGNTTSDWRGVSIADARQRIQADSQTLADLWSRPARAARIRRDGFLTHSKDFVLGMELDWGGWYGDMMHFDMRNIGAVGTAIESAKVAVMTGAESVDSYADAAENRFDEASEAFDDEVILEAIAETCEHCDGDVKWEDWNESTEPRMGWPDASRSPAKDGSGTTIRSDGWNQREARVGTMRRIPISGLEIGNQSEGRMTDSFGGQTEEIAKGRAIVWVPTNFDIDRPATILLHLHGMTIGYRQDQNGHVEDVVEMQIAGQLSSNDANLITILPQGSTASQGFGPAFRAQPYVDEVIAALIQLGILAHNPQIGRRILSGYSGGGNVIWRMLYNTPEVGMPQKDHPHEPLSRPFDLFLFDAIHDGQAERIWKWLKKLINKAIDDILQMPAWDMLGIAGQIMAMPQFTGFHTNGSYKAHYETLKSLIDTHFAAEKRRRRISEQVLDLLAGNFRIAALGHGDHLQAIGRDIKTPEFKKQKPLKMAMERDWSKLQLGTEAESWTEQISSGTVAMVVGTAANLHSAPTSAGVRRLPGNPVLPQSILVTVGNSVTHRGSTYVEVTEIVPGGSRTPMTGWVLESKLKSNDASALNWANVKASLVAVAVREFNAWSATGLRCERVAGSRTALTNYWGVVGSRPTASNLGSLSWQDDHPWSAAFISFVVNEAGIGDHFFLSAGHACYIAWARQNQLTGYANNPFKAFATTEPDAAWPAPGDILCKNREGGQLTVDNIRCGNVSHCDVVVEVDRTLRRLITIGGNVDDRVARRTVHLDANGFIDPNLSWAIEPVGGAFCQSSHQCGSQREYLGVIKVTTVQPAAPAVTAPQPPATTSTPVTQPPSTYRMQPESENHYASSECGCGECQSHAVREECDCNECRSRRQRRRPSIAHLGQHSDCYECAEHMLTSWQDSGLPSDAEALVSHPKVHAQWAREAFDQLALGRGPVSASQKLGGFKVMLRPGESMKGDLLPGDLLIARNYGAGTAEAFLLESGEVFEPHLDRLQRHTAAIPLCQECIRCTEQHDLRVYRGQTHRERRGYLNRNLMVLRRMPESAYPVETTIATLTVEVRTDFMRRSGSTLQHDWVNGRGIRNATVEIEGQEHPSYHECPWGSTASDRHTGRWKLCGDRATQRPRAELHRGRRAATRGKPHHFAGAHLQALASGDPDPRRAFGSGFRSSRHQARWSRQQVAPQHFWKPTTTGLEAIMVPHTQQAL